MRNASNVAVGTWTMTDIPITGGGHTTSIAVADDGTWITRTDTNNAFIRGPSATAWTPLIRYGDNIMTLPVIDPWTSDWGTTAADICATNSAIAYWYFDGYIWKTTDGGDTIAKCAGWTRYTHDPDFRPNSGQIRLSGTPMVVDPINGNVLWIGITTGVKYTQDGGVNFTTVSTATLPAPTAGKRITICFDRSSAQTGGKTQGILIGIPGSGVYRSNDAGATWAILGTQPGAITTGVNMIYAHPVTGNIYVCGDGSGNPNQAHRYMSGTWTAIPTLTESASISMKPTDNTKMYSFQGGGAVQFSSDNGVTWGAPKYPLRVAPNAPWLAWTDEVYMGHSASVHSPLANEIVIANGIGPWKYSSLQNDAGGGNYTVNEFAKGIENLQSEQIVALDGGFIATAQDRPIFTRAADQLNVPPAIHGGNKNTQLQHCDDVDYASDDPDFLVGIVADAADGTGTNLWVSEDRGRTAWSLAPTDFKTVGGAVVTSGNIAVSTKLNWVAVGGQNGGHPVYTLDGGVTWNNCNIGGNNNEYYSNSYTFFRKILVADKDTPGTFYIYNSLKTEDAGGLASIGVWKSTNGGVSWTRMLSTHITTFGNFGQNASIDFFNGTLACVPGKPGHLFWSAGDGGDGLYKSTDSGATWTKGTGSGETFKYGIGVAKPGGTYPPILMYGFRSGVCAWYLSEDGADTWSSAITIYDNGGGNAPACIDGCKVKYGRFFLSLVGRSYAYIDFTDKATC